MREYLVRHPATLRRIAIIGELLSLGFPLSHIAARLGLSRRYARDLIAGGTTKIGRPIDEAMRQAIRQGHATGATLQEVAQSLGRSKDTVRVTAGKMGLKLRRSRYRSGNSLPDAQNNIGQKTDLC